MRLIPVIAKQNRLHYYWTTQCHMILQSLMNAKPSEMTYRCDRQENRRDLMTKQAVVVRRKMDTPIAVVATLGIELTIFSFCSP